VLAALAVLAVSLAGCGGSSRPPAGHAVTVPSYAGFPATTVTAADASPEICRVDVTAVTDDARQFVAHSGPQAAYPADLAYVNLRLAFDDFDAKACDPALLGKSLAQALTPKQRRVLLEGLPDVLAGKLRSALRAGS
jgi:hypothetical protein